MRNVIRNIIKVNQDIGRWIYPLLVIMIPLYYFAKLFDIHNKSYEYKDDGRN